MQRFFVFAVAVTGICLLASGAAAQAPLHVAGGGGADVTDIFGDTYTAKFSVAAVIPPQGNVQGAINFVFDQPFSNAWGVPDLGADIDLIHVWGPVTAASVAEDGTITLSGFATDAEISFAAGVLLVAENEPFEVVISGPDEFRFYWCELPWFDFEVTAGSVSVR